MDSEKYTRNVEMLCPTCGSSQFRYDKNELENDNCLFECPHCRLTLTKAELIEENRETLEVNAQEIGQKVVADLIDKLNKEMRRYLSFTIK